MLVYDYLLDVKKRRGAGFALLLDPDKGDHQDLFRLAGKACESGVDLLFIGGSILINAGFDAFVYEVKQIASVPVVIFPGNAMQISRFADAILFLSLVSGRDPHYLIGEHVLAAPVLKQLGIEPISTGYMLIESGQTTSVEFMSNTRPIPRDKIDIAKATALAAEYLGMRLLYLEAGSGARQAVPIPMIEQIAAYVQTPIIVGGGIKSPDGARKRVDAGASFVVMGNFFEAKLDGAMMEDFAAAIHANS